MNLPQVRLLMATRSWWGRSLGGRGYARMRELDLDTHMLAFSAQQVLCTAPLVVAISSVLDRFTGRDVSGAIIRFFALHREAGDAVQDLFSHASRRLSLSELVFGLVVAVLFTTSVATTQQRAFELIWTLPRVISVKGYIRQLLWVPALAVFIAALLVISRFVRALHMTPIATQSLIVVVQAVVVFFFYWWTQRWLLHGRVEWRALLPGAVAVAVATVVTVRLSRLIMDGQITWQVEAYGLVGAVFVLSVWLGIFSAVIFAGILAGAVWVERRHVPGRARANEVDESPLTKKGMRSAERGRPVDPPGAGEIEPADADSTADSTADRSAAPVR
ncbi:YhjD/YihY/BrkB family envelope integrity protein [Jatrophihabitans fulvus]